MYVSRQSGRVANVHGGLGIENGGFKTPCDYRVKFSRTVQEKCTAFGIAVTFPSTKLGPAGARRVFYYFRITPRGGVLSGEKVWFYIGIRLQNA